MVRVTVLGSGDAFGAGGRLHSAYLVETRGATFLLDCGPTILQGLKRVGADPNAIDFVLLSHMHGDHFAGVPFLLLEYRYQSGRTRPLGLYGPPDMAPRVRAATAALYESLDREPLPFAVRYEHLPGVVPTTIQGVRVMAIPVPHVATLVCFAYRIEIGDKTILFSGDTGWTEALVEAAQGVDLFVCECSTYETQIDVHLAYPQIAARAADFGCRRLVLSHLGAEVLARRTELTLECAEDGMVIEL